jgi:hypothetical protein
MPLILSLLPLDPLECFDTSERFDIDDNDETLLIGLNPFGVGPREPIA